MKNKIIAVVLMTIMLLSVSFCVKAETINLSPFDNELFDVAGAISEADAASAASHGKIVDEYIENYPDTVIVRTYEDGARIRTPLIGAAFENCAIEFADEGFPAYLDKKADNKFVKIEQGYADMETVTWYYLLEVNGEEVREQLICTVIETRGEAEQVTVTYTTVNPDGTETDETVGPMTYEQYREHIGVSGYNDGLIYKSRYQDEGYETGYYDIDVKVVFPSPEISYYTLDYNLGYFTEVYNNGGELDWSQEDAEKQRVFHTEITNYATRDIYVVDNAWIEGFWDNGYGIMGVKNENGDDIEYLVKLKKHAIITVQLNGRKIEFDQVPIVENGRTLVPMRAIFESLGAEVMWNGDTNEITAVKGDVAVTFTLNSSTVYKNGEKIILDVPAKAINGRTFVPVRAIAESFSVDTQWSQEDNMVVLTSK